MSRGVTQRTIEIINKEKDSYGTGCLIAAGLVLTAHHVAKPAAGSGVRVRDMESASFTDAVVVWENTELDAVLLKADRSLVGAGMKAVRFGELVCDYPAYRPPCTLTGFPRAMRRKASASPVSYINDAKTVLGYVNPHTGSRSRVYGIEVDGALPSQPTDWQGLSGAGLFCEGTLIALMRSVPTKWQGVLLALPLSHLLAADGFAQTVAAHTGTPARLQPADLKPLFDTLPEPKLSSSYLLDPRAQVVNLTGMTQLTDQLERWCRSRDIVDVATVTGLGGTGKSRLVTELLHRLTQTTASSTGQRPWSGGFLAETPGHTDYGMLGAAAYPLLIAIDLAETRLSQVNDVVKALANRHDGYTNIRVLLLARGPGNWWSALRRQLRAQHVGASCETFSITPGDALSGLSTEDIYISAKADFARRIRLLQHAGQNDDTWKHGAVADAPRQFGADVESAPQQPVIYLHIAALADVLARANPDLAREDSPMEVLLGNEENYLLRIAASLLPAGTYDRKLIRTLVTAQFLAGARTAQEGRAAVSAGFDVHHHGYRGGPPDQRQLAAWDDVLATAYPSNNGAHWGTVCEPLAVTLLTDVEDTSGNEFVEHFLQHDALKEDQRRQALSAIARTADEQPDLAASAHRAVAAAPERLLPLAAKTITAELSADRATQWLADLQNAVTHRARQPEADQDTYQWATELLSEAQAQTTSHPTDGSAANVNDVETYLRFLDDFSEWSQRQLQRNAAQSSGSNDDDSETATQSDGTQLVLVKPTVSRPSRILITAVALCQLLLVAAVSSGAALTSDFADRWVLWLSLPTMNLGMDFFIASVYGGTQLPRSFATWVVPPFTLFVHVLAGMMLNEQWPLPSGYPPPWLLWPTVFTPGLLALPYAWRTWFGQLREPRTA